jgi:DNA modification methylase
MRKYRDKNQQLLFSWAVIERDVKRLIEEGRAVLIARNEIAPSQWVPKKFHFEKSTIWDFPSRGNWAVHRGNYRGNWPPEVPRNLILKYSHRGGLVLDPFVGGGTTLIEAWITNRRSIGIDISPFAEQLSKVAIEEMEMINEKMVTAPLIKDYKPIMIRGDARNIFEIMSNLGFGPESVDLILAHPPYLDSMKYTFHESNDLSHISDVNAFKKEMRKVASGLYRLLKIGRICAVLIGDVRKEGRIIPLGFQTMNCFMEEGFGLLYPIVKKQHKDLSTAFYYGKKSIPYLIAHEYLFIFEKRDMRKRGQPKLKRIKRLKAYRDEKMQ